MPSPTQSQRPSDGNLLDEALPLPAAVIYQSRLSNNLGWMQRFADRQKVKLCPHGKTTMTPAFFRQQLASGAWGLALAKVPQVLVAFDAGARRILMANQLVGRANMAQVSELLRRGGPTFEFYCLVDSPDNVRQLGEYFGAWGQTLTVLVEVGVPSGRCGCRTRAEVDAVAAAVAAEPALKLAGVETYEGMIHGADAATQVRNHLRFVHQTCLDLMAQGHFDTDTVILTGAGSAWYDIVADEFMASGQEPIQVVIRPGCYLIHDRGIYLEAQAKIMARLPGDGRPSGDLQSSLEVWAYVQSVPEPGMAILTLGKREVAFDAGLPQPSLHFRPGDNAPRTAPEAWRVTHIMDHHSTLSVPPEADIRVGDVVALSTSHPCLTFDKWRELLVIDDQYEVLERVATHF